jgi:hypothetical protein
MSRVTLHMRVLVFESCDGEPTGRLAWYTGPAEDVARCWPAR